MTYQVKSTLLPFGGAKFKTRKEAEKLARELNSSEGRIGTVKVRKMT